MSKTKKPVPVAKKVTKKAPAPQHDPKIKKQPSQAASKAEKAKNAPQTEEHHFDHDHGDGFVPSAPVEAPLNAAAPAVTRTPTDGAPVSGDDEDFYLTDAEGNRYCRVRDCDQIATVDMYCRYHYLLLWKKIQVRKKILMDGKLEFYIVELTSRYPDKFLEMIRRDLRTQKDFVAAIQELEIDESGLDNDFEEEDTQYIDEVRGMGTGGGGGETESVEDEF